MVTMVCTVYALTLVAIVLPIRVMVFLHNSLMSYELCSIWALGVIDLQNLKINVGKNIQSGEKFKSKGGRAASALLVEMSKEHSDTMNGCP